VCGIDGNCKSKNTIYAIINVEKNTLHRLTFSKSLAELIIKNMQNLKGDGKYEMKELMFIIGKRLNPDETSKSGLYALMTKDYCLRISLDKRIADLHSKDESRYLAEAWLG
jgi:hypothetical protein